ncbi:hypothetical protein HispidOSU_027419, partial [Sigmodon hispidus]
DSLSPARYYSFIDLFPPKPQCASLIFKNVFHVNKQTKMNFDPETVLCAKFLITQADKICELALQGASSVDLGIQSDTNTTSREMPCHTDARGSVKKTGASCLPRDKESLATEFSPLT